MNQRARQVEPEVPYDASNAEHVAEREKKAKRREDVRVEGLRYIMADPRGRAFMRHLLNQKLFTRVGKSLPPGPLFTGNSSTFYNASLRELGDLIQAEIAHHASDQMKLMETEGDA